MSTQPSVSKPARCPSCEHRIYMGIAKYGDECRCEEMRREGYCPICKAAGPLCSGEEKHYRNRARGRKEATR
ncbi:MAG: hypothetical protein M0000_06355 [Actinomycetota bacterium]|nr:hypothetical protein [Actinomycetota bacterium]